MQFSLCVVLHHLSEPSLSSAIDDSRMRLHRSVRVSSSLILSCVDPQRRAGKDAIQATALFTPRLTKIIRMLRSTAASMFLACVFNLLLGMRWPFEQLMRICTLLMAHIVQPGSMAAPQNGVTEARRASENVLYGPAVSVL